jgi:hypothetical protein
MAGNDDKTYGFRKDDADALIGMIGMGESETPGRRIGAGGGGGGGDVLYIFVMSSDMVSNQASSDFYRLDGASRGADLPGSTLYDPEGVFAGLKINATGYCIKQGDKYYAIQANCQDEIL